ncbi:enterochelin esterase family protein [Nakamurella sp. UYEF19]|uniref:alpha/beta hydrolase n=1 Tax=Nakamurella sp. UYEF19 TaxID=1756392 RepID=UPI00339B640A
MPWEETPLLGVTQTSSAGVVFRFPHAPGVQAVRVEVDWPLGDTGPDLRLQDGQWQLELPRPAVDRMEYQFLVRAAHGTAVHPDPGNPLRVGNPFGEKSEIRFPEYRMPGWLTGSDGGRCRPLATAVGKLACPVPVTLWAPDGLDSGVTAPLLLANDGSDMTQRGSLLVWATAAIKEHGPFRVALLDPAHGLRDAWYAAGADYADHVALTVLPAIGAQVAVGRTVGLGASLGALSMLMIAQRHPGVLHALALQSGSFFTAALDPQESGYDYFDRICSAVGVLATGPAVRSDRVLMTCGAVEENLANNELMATALAAQGYRVQSKIVPDAHTMIGWRDAWSPGLEELMSTP